MTEIFRSFLVFFDEGKHSFWQFPLPSFFFEDPFPLFEPRSFFFSAYTTP